MLTARRLLTPGLLVLVLGLGAAGCSGESGPIDDGTYSSLRAGAPAILADLDVTLISLEVPAAARPDEVVEALSDQRLTAETYPLDSFDGGDGVALEPERIAGLLGLVGSVGSGSAGSGNVGSGNVGSGSKGQFVVLSFDGLESAVVFAASDPQVFADVEQEAVRSAYFSGNLVAYYASEGSSDTTDRFRAALDALAGT